MLTDHSHGFAVNTDGAGPAAFGGAFDTLAAGSAPGIRPGGTAAVRIYSCRLARRRESPLISRHLVGAAGLRVPERQAVGLTILYLTAIPATSNDQAFTGAKPAGQLPGDGR